MLTVSDTKNSIGANAGDITGLDDPYFEELEADVIGWLEGTGLKRWLTVPAERVELLDGPSNGSRRITCRGFLRSLVTVEVRADLTSDWEELVCDAVADADNEVEYTVGGEEVWRRAACWPAGERTVRLTYMAGYTQAYAIGDAVPAAIDPGLVALTAISTDAPRDIQRLVRLLCAVWHRTRPVQRSGGDGEIDLEDLPMSARWTIERYSASRLP